MKSPFPDVFDELLFLYASLFSGKSVSSSHYRTNTHHVAVLNSPSQISSKWILNRGQDIKYRYLINKSSKDSMHNTEFFSWCQIKLPNLISWKLIATRWILRQYNINAIITYFKYLIRQFDFTSEWNLILQLARLRVAKITFPGTLSWNNLLIESWKKEV